MGSLNIDFIAKDTTTKSEHLYSDVHLDLVNDYKKVGNYDREFTNLVDIKVSFDVQAVKNSLTSILGTNLGERLLLPEFGLNIKRFLFAPVSEGCALSIGELMTEAIERWEPRVLIRELKIFPNIDDQRYDISLDFHIPSLKTDANFLGSILQGEGFVQG